MGTFSEEARRDAIADVILSRNCDTDSVPPDEQRAFALGIADEILAALEADTDAAVWASENG